MFKVKIGLFLLSATGLFSQVTAIPGVSGVSGSSNLTTAGAVPYVSAAGTLNQDAAAFFWDAANNRLGIGTNAPAFALDVSGSSATARIYDQTVTTGVSTLTIRAGAGQSATNLLSLQTAAGSTVANFYLSGGSSIIEASVISQLAGQTQINSSGLGLANSEFVLWSSGAGAGGSYDSGLSRAAAGNVAVTDGSSGRGRIVLIQSTPAASTDACTAGALWSDANYVYACTASGVIKRATLNTF